MMGALYILSPLAQSPAFVVDASTSQDATLEETTHTSGQDPSYRFSACVTSILRATFAKASARRAGSWPRALGPHAHTGFLREPVHALPNPF